MAIVTTTSVPATTTTTLPSTPTTSTTLADETAICGDGMTEQQEECDDGDTMWNPGESCRADCTRVSCADADDSGSVTASDALFMLRAAVASEACGCVCDVDASDGPTTASDALRALRAVVGLSVVLLCPCAG
jgi:cysteine-rich repeat protein